MRILFITSNRIGDAILSTGVLGALIERYPGCRITIACGPLAVPIFRHAPGVEHIHVMRKAPLIGHWRKLLAATMFRRWDLVVDIRGSATAYVLRAGERRVLRPDHSKHRVPHIASVLDLDPPPAPRVWPGEAARARAAAAIPEGRIVLAVGPTANWARKTWPAGRFAELVARLTGEGGALAGAHVLIAAAPDEREATAQVRAAVPADRLIDLVGEELDVVAAFLERSRFFVGNDSGLMHLAVAAGTPTLGLFGPTRDDLYGPWGPKAAFVRGPRSCAEIIGDPDFDKESRESAMLDLTVDNVLKAADALIARTASPARERETRV
ncbi:MAG: glycosyltransferase family 9 protein [Parvibaculaceae bacterium]|nr:glycosyltransferase family 9 protein [Parvibaculaceae bacterium]